MKDSARRLIAMSLWLVFLGGSAVLCCSGAPGSRGESAEVAMEPCKALRKGFYELAVKGAEKYDEPLRKAEALILLERYDEAEAVCVADPCGQSRLLLGVIAERKGFPERAHQLYQEAADLGVLAARGLVTLGSRS